MRLRPAAVLLMPVLLFAGAGHAEPTIASPTTFEWAAFGDRLRGRLPLNGGPQKGALQKRMPQTLKGGPGLPQVYLVADQVARKLESLHILPNFDDAGRARGQRMFGPDYCYLGNCGHTSECLYQALVGAGIPPKSLKRIVVLKRQPDGMIEPDLNADHVVICYLDRDGPRTFDLWCSGRGQTTYARFASSEWNGLPLSEWVQKMRRERYAYAYIQDHPELHETSPELLVDAVRNLQAR